MRIEVRRGRKVMSSKRPKKMQIFKNLIKMTLDMMHEFWTNLWEDSDHLAYHLSFKPLVPIILLFYFIT